MSVARRGDGDLKSVLLKRRDDHAGVDSIGSSDPDVPGTLGRVGPDCTAT